MKHAYLILAHNNYAYLERLLRFLDSENADFFIHMDAKARDFDPDRFSRVTGHSRVTFVKRFNIRWGHFSMVEAELELLRASLPGGYDYYHLLSGADVPVKTRTQIEGFFEAHPGRNYVNFMAPEISRENLFKVRFYYPFQTLNIRRLKLRRTLRNITAGAQLVLGLDRTKKYPSGMKFQKGAQWWSITGEFAACLLSRESEIRRYFENTYCPDEIFTQTVMIGSPFVRTLPENAFADDYASCLRYIDWHRGNPYVFREEDLEELLSLPEHFLFARKVDPVRTPGLIDALYDRLS